MKIQLNTDANIQSTKTLIDKVCASVEQALEHVKEHITRVEVHLSDESKGKSGQHDQRCMLEARLEGRKPVAVTDHATNLEQAVDGAAKKLAHMLESTIGRQHNRHNKTSTLPLLEGSQDQC